VEMEEVAALLPRVERIEQPAKTDRGEGGDDEQPKCLLGGQHDDEDALGQVEGVVEALLHPVHHSPHLFLHLFLEQLIDSEV